MSQYPDGTFAEVLAQFCGSSEIPAVFPLGNGNINQTFLVQDKLQQRFVLQRLNSAVFPEPLALIENFRIVTEHISSASSQAGLTYQCPQLIRTVSGDQGYCDSLGNYWRAQSYIVHFPPKDIQLDIILCRKLGQTLGRFHLLTGDLDITLLQESLPGFHITPSYLKAFDVVASAWDGEGNVELDLALGYVEKYRYIATHLEHQKESGRLRLQTIHGDPKLDNIIFNQHGEATGLFDLDTVGSGLLHYDLGDCLRSCCNTHHESSSDYTGVVFDVDICEAVLAGYMEAAGESLTDHDRSMLFDGVAVITFELGLRFLLDHLQGNIYFSVEKNGMNLQRALVQFSLVDSIFRQEDEIRQCSSNV